MDALTKKILENAKARRAKSQLQSDADHASEKENKTKTVIPLIENFEKIIKENPASSPSKFTLTEKIPSIKTRIDSIQLSANPLTKESNSPIKDANPAKKSLKKQSSPTFLGNLCDNNTVHAHNITESSHILSKGHEDLNLILKIPNEEYKPLKRKNSIEIENAANTDTDFELKAKQFKSGEIEDKNDSADKSYQFSDSNNSVESLTEPSLFNQSGSTITSSVCEKAYQGIYDTLTVNMAKETLPRPFGKEIAINHEVATGRDGATGHDYAKTPILYPSTPNTPKILVCEEVGQPTTSKTSDSNYGSLEKRPEFEMYDSFSYQKLQNMQKKEEKTGKNVIYELPNRASSQNSIDFTDFCLIHNHEHKKEAICEIKRNLAEIQSIILQTSQALNLACSQNKSKRFITLEIIEAERHLLLSTQKRNYFKEKEEQIITGNMSCICEAPNTYRYRVNLTLKEFTLSIRPEHFLLYNKDFDIYYFCFIVSYKQYIMCTCAISITDIENNSLNFSNIFKFFNVDISESIRIQLFAFCQTHAQQITSSAKLKKFKLPKIDLTPKKGNSFFRKFGSNNSSSCDPIMPPRSTNFTYVGEINLLASKSGTQKLSLSNIIFDCPITGLLTCNVEAQQINQCYAKGFLTLFDESGKANLWRRYWCGLFRDCISLWNYPEEELSKNPVKEIKLKWASQEENVQILSQCDCARPHTFEISVAESHPSKPKFQDVVIYRFSADFKAERAKWVAAFKLHVEKYFSNKKFPSTSVPKI